jgi:hypothetical protein
MLPGVGKPKIESAWALGNGPKEVRKKETIVDRLRIFLNMLNLLLRKKALS